MQPVDMGQGFIKNLLTVTRTYLKNKIRVQKQVELCEIPRIGGVKRLKSGTYTYM